MNSMKLPYLKASGLISSLYLVLYFGQHNLINKKRKRYLVSKRCKSCPKPK